MSLILFPLAMTTTSWKFGTHNFNLAVVLCQLQRLLGVEKWTFHMVSSGLFEFSVAGTLCWGLISLA